MLGVNSISGKGKSDDSLVTEWDDSGGFVQSNKGVLSWT